MINIILMLSLSLVNAQPATQTAPEAVAIQPCVWPNLCRQIAATATEIAPAAEVAKNA